MFRLNPKTGTLTTLASLPLGEEPWGNLAIDAAGNLYGTTEYGGAADLGTVFEVMRQN